MKAADLEILLQEGEGAMLEYKESLSSSFARELVAFANTAGGRILLGVRDDGTVKGITDTNDLRARIQDIARNCDPPIKILLHRVGEVISVTVRESDAKPVQCSDGFFWRQGAVTQKLSRDEIRSFFQESAAIRFDLSVCTRFRYPQDFDPEKFHDWLGKSTIARGGAVEDILVNIEAAERAGGKLVFRNAGVLFFAREPRRFFNQAYVTCLLFKGVDKVHVLDRKDFAGGVVADLEDSLRFIERNTRTAYRIEKLQREEIPEYPMAALREAITNAVMHRDWFIEGANVFIEIFEDRIEVSSPGGLPKGMLPQDLGHKSVRRNPLIADLLHRIAFIEKAGTGIRRMRDGARAQGYPEPTFSTDNFFTAMFRPIAPVRKHDQAHHEAHDQAHDEAHEPLGSVESRLLAECAVEPQSSTALLQSLGHRTRSGGFKAALNRLMALGYLEMTLPDKPRSKNQRYRTTPSGRMILEQREKETNS
ncbi:MAG: ATP-binding protein [FCB group bacterium]|jgi:ATP-dependent DNA helicase RecG|nr:ATP-binding protein [FCB group bacterium]